MILLLDAILHHQNKLIIIHFYFLNKDYNYYIEKKKNCTEMEGEKIILPKKKYIQERKDFIFPYYVPNLDVFKKKSKNLCYNPLW